MNIKFLPIFLILIFFTGNTSLADKMIIDDMSTQSGQPDEEFCEAGNAKWCFVTDKVMGGLSEGSLEVKK